MGRASRHNECNRDLTFVQIQIRRTMPRRFSSQKVRPAFKFRRRCAEAPMPSKSLILLALVLIVTFVFVATPRQGFAQTFTDLYNFCPVLPCADGSQPFAGLVMDTMGNLYGTAPYGGSSAYGVVFKVDSSGAESVLYSFTGSADGGRPFAALLRDKHGTLYGTSVDGGAFSNGVVFQIDSAGKETVLHSFKGKTTEGCYPYQGLVEDRAGNFYGTTFACGASNQGTVFKLSPKGKATVLHSFEGGSKDGGYPFYGGLLMDAAGNLYGVTLRGGPTNQGVLYKLTRKRALTVLHGFAGGTKDGCYPQGIPVMDRSGNLYGTTEACGASGLGIVWKVSQNGAETILHHFGGGSADGATPTSGVVLDANGDLYGDTTTGGSQLDTGTVYELSNSGTLTLLHSFEYTEGAFPYGGLLRDAKGGLYGTAYFGGTYSWGTAWTYK